jgi:cell wall-associated NlpC family hydrolase
MFCRFFRRFIAVLSLYLSTLGSALATSSNTIAREALKLRGVRYVWGGESRFGLDCSGLTRYIYKRIGIMLPHSARRQAFLGRKVVRGGWRPGDLLFFRTRRGRIGHVGVYVGSGKMVHAPRPGKRVCAIPVSFMGRKLVTARRLVR